MQRLQAITNKAKRKALQAVFGCRAEDLGFIPPPAPEPPLSEDDVHRRRFCGAATGTAVAVAGPLLVARPAVGTSDVIRARMGLGALTALDQTRGGHAALEKAALAGARETLELQKRAATERIRQRPKLKVRQSSARVIRRHRDA